MADAELALPAPAVPAPTWRVTPPAPPWCPEALADHLPWAAGLAYEDVVATRLPGPRDWSLLGGTRRGRLHAHRGEFREDAFRLGTGDSFLVLVAADGAGSSRLSRVASELACRTAELAVSRQLATGPAPSVDRAGLRDWLSAVVGAGPAAAVTALHRLAAAGGVPPSDLRTTLLLAAWYHSPRGSFLAGAQVGDGFIVVARGSGRVERVGQADVAEYSGEVSCFLPDAGSAERGRATTVLEADDLTAILLGTDGIEDPFYPIERHAAVLHRQLREGVTTPAPEFQRQERHGPVFGPDGEARLLAWLGFERRGENDDRTLVAAWR